MAEERQVVVARLAFLTAGGLGGGGLNTWSTGDAYTIILAGTHTAIPDPLIMTDAAATFAVGALIGLTINNTTDGSSGVITDNDATTVTCGRYFMVDAAHPVPVTIAGAPGFISAKADIFNTALPAIGVDWLGADVAPTVSPSHLAIYVVVAVAGVLSVARTNGGVTVVEQLNQGVALTANVAYGFKVSWLTGDTINFQYSATGANILRLIANEELL